MRHNGLPAASFSPIADVPPSAAQTALDSLKEQGIAAYVVPAPDTAEQEPADDASESSLQRLWVDGDATTAAREAMALLPDVVPLPELELQAVELSDDGLQRPRDVPVDEDLWAQIVASFHSSPDRADGAGDDDTESPRRGRLLRGASDESSERAPDSGVAQSWESTAPEPPEEQEAPEHDTFVPELPAPPPEGSPLSKLGWLGVLGGPLYLLVSVLLRWSVPSWAGIAALVGFIGGFVLLVSRMRTEDDPYDDGARL